MAYSAEAIRAEKLRRLSERRQRQASAYLLDPRAREFMEYLSGKSVIVVGPADYLTGAGRGAWIDSHDVVVRLNWGAPVPAGKERDYGTRTDVLYKRLLKLGILDQIDVEEYEAAGLRWVVAVESAQKPENKQHMEAMLGDRIPYFFERLSYRELRQAMRNNPLVGMIAVHHLLKSDLRSLTVTGCDFYASGYHVGYGGRAYRESLQRKEGTISPRHDADVQQAHLYRMRSRDSRLRFDETLSGLVVSAARRYVARDAAVIIPARYASSRFPGKPLAPIAGKPMILHVCERAAQAVETVVVATDDHRIAQCVTNAGYRAVMTGDCATGTDRVAEAARSVRASIYVNVQGDEPLVDPADILALIEAKRANYGSVVNGMCRLEGDPYDPTAVKVAVAGARMVYASRAPIPATKDGHRAEWKQLGLYAFSDEDLQWFSACKRGLLEAAEDVELLRFVEHGRPIHMVQVGAAQAVDLPEHIAAVEALMNREAVPA